MLQQNTEKAAEQTTPPLGVVLQPYYLSAIAFIIGFLSLLDWQTWQKREPKERFFQIKNRMILMIGLHKKP